MKNENSFRHFAKILGVILILVIAAEFSLRARLYFGKFQKDSVNHGSVDQSVLIVGGSNAVSIKGEDSLGTVLDRLLKSDSLSLPVVNLAYPGAKTKEIISTLKGSVARYNPSFLIYIAPSLRNEIGTSVRGNWSLVEFLGRHSALVKFLWSYYSRQGDLLEQNTADLSHLSVDEFLVYVEKLSENALFQKALDLLDERLKSSSNPRLYETYMDVAFDSGDFSKVRLFFEKYMNQLKDGPAIFCYYRALAREQLGEIKSIIERRLEKETSSCHLSLEKEVVELYLGNKRSLRDFKIKLNLCSDHEVEVYESLFSAGIDLRRFDIASLAAKEMIEHFPNSYIGYYSNAYLFQLQGKYRESNTWGERAILMLRKQDYRDEVTRQIADMEIILGVNYQQQGIKEKAKKHFQRALVEKASFETIYVACSSLENNKSIDLCRNQDATLPDYYLFSQYQELIDAFEKERNKGIMLLPSSAIVRSLQILNPRLEHVTLASMKEALEEDDLGQAIINTRIAQHLTRDQVSKLSDYLFQLIKKSSR